MRVAITYRPKSAAPLEQLPMMMGALGEWVQTWSGRVETIEFFAIGGGLVLADLDDAKQLHQLVAGNPFTPYMEVDVMPIVEPAAAMETLRDFVGHERPPEANS